MSNIDVFFVTSFLCSLKFVLFHLTGHTKRCLHKNIENCLSVNYKSTRRPGHLVAKSVGQLVANSEIQYVNSSPNIVAKHALKLCV